MVLMFYVVYFFHQEYTNELSRSTQDAVLAIAETLKDKLRGIVQKGMESDKILPDFLIMAINKVQTALNMTDTSSLTTSNATVLNMFQPAADYMLSDTSGLTLNYASDDERLKALTSKAMDIISDLLLVPLLAQVAGEKEITLSLSDGSSLLARHILVEDANDDVAMNGVLIKPGNALNYVNYNESSVFQYILVYNFNPLNYGFSDVLPVTTRTLTFAFHKPDGENLAVSNLPENSTTAIYLFPTDVTPYEVSSNGLPNSTDYNPLDKMKYSSKLLSADTLYHVNISHPGKAEVAIHIQVRANFTQSANPDTTLNAKLYKNNEPYLDSDGQQYEIDLKRAHVDNPKNDHRNYTFFINHR